ncbi:MAG TPA: putative metal-binding motif-containing protein [Candidatus Polarisedimenticolia bacterium]|nr:putative metal-binding motif-containing protein [Candidatus Polarisedimenticolia bacterium]
MKATRFLGRVALGVAFAVAAGLQPPPAAVSDFSYYVDFASPATTNCTPTSSGCTGQCASPTCGTQATPCHSIQAAINIANCNIGANTALEADVNVAAGTYPERLFVYPNIHLIGAGKDVTTIDAKGLLRSAVIMSKQTLFGFARPGVKFSITGFRIIHGSGDRIDLVDSGGNHYFQMGGGGMLLFGQIGTTGWPSVTDCRIEDNTIIENTPATPAPDWNGGGIYVAVGGPIISGNIIQRNTITPPNQSGQVDALGWGAGIYSLNFDCLPLITRNVVRNNVTVAQVGSGAGMNVAGNEGTIISNNLVVGNSANIEGGGIYIYAAAASAYNNVVFGNIGGGAGGGFSTGSPIADIDVTNNTVVGNVLTVHTVPKGAIFSSVGGGIYSSFILSQQSQPLNHLTNNLVAKNDATSLGGGGGLYTYNAFATNDHNDYFGDAPNEIRGDYTEATVVGTNGNLSVDPVFANIPTFWDHTNAAGASNTVVVFDATRYAVGNQIEYNDDGVARQITGINTSTKTLTFTPAITYKTCSNAVNASCTVNTDCVSPGTCNTVTTQANRILANWGASTNVTEDLRLTASSPVRDAGTNTPQFGTTPTTDYDQLPRPVDGDQNGSLINDIGAYEFRLPDTDGDGVGDALDCDDLVNSVWTAPPDVAAPLSISSAQMLSWMHAPQSNVYNVYRGTITSPWTWNPSCFASEIPGLSTSIAASAPALGTAQYFVVGGVNSCGSGPIHTVSTVFPPSVCDPAPGDADGDGVANLNDNCPTVSNNTQLDPEHDTVGTACDNCPTTYNPNQLDVNANSQGDHCEDGDGDGSFLVNDCNDSNPAIHPGATEICNGVDDNCTAGIDEGFDGDGDGVTTCGGDCNDANPAIRPGATEICNGVDDNCTGGIDEGFDADGDTFTTCGGDCNDSNVNIHPGAAEVCNGLDDNCTAGIDEGGNALCSDTNSCTSDVCGGAAGCQFSPVPDGNACNDSNACTQTDACASGVCNGTNPVVCSAPDTCHDAGTCNTTSGACENAPPKPDNTPCSDADLCTQTDTCQTGVCTGSNPVVCSPSDDCHDPGTCAPATGVCSVGAPKANGSSCSDGNACTMNDTCQTGVCQAGGLRDGDGDAHVDGLCGGDDCNDLNNAVWHAPFEVTNLILTTTSPANPAWDSQAGAAGPETTYDLVSGSFGPGGGSISFAAASCLQSGGAGNSFPDGRPDPTAGLAYWYLARGRNSCGTGTYGTVPRDTNIPACP